MHTQVFISISNSAYIQIMMCISMLLHGLTKPKLGKQGRQMKKHTSRQVERQPGSQADKQISREAASQTSPEAGREADRQKENQIIRQADK